MSDKVASYELATAPKIRDVVINAPLEDVVSVSWTTVGGETITSTKALDVYHAAKAIADGARMRLPKEGDPE